MEFSEIATIVGKSDVNARQILTRARARLHNPQPRFQASRRESEEIVRRFRRAVATGSLQEMLDVLDVDAQLIADGGGKVAAATRPVIGAERIAKFILGYAGKLNWTEADFSDVSINGTPGLLLRHPLAGDSAYAFDIVDGKVRAVLIVRNPDKLRAFLDPQRAEA
jgi:RNA polymerase sigma-70 factor (ECF subfamily)